MDSYPAEVAAQGSLVQRPRRRARRQAEYQADAEAHLDEAADHGRVIGLDLPRLRLKDAEVFQRAGHRRVGDAVRRVDERKAEQVARDQSAPPGQWVVLRRDDD